MRQAARRGFTLIELLVVIAIIGVLVGMLLPAVQSVREAARRAECTNNMRQLGLALHGFESAFRVFPASGWTQAGPGNPQGKYVSWRPLILPFVEQTALRDLYDVGLNWWEGSNLVTASVPVLLFQCPSTPNRGNVISAVAKSPRPALTFANPVAPTDYEAIQGIQPSNINPHLTQPIYTASNRFSAMHRNSTNRFRDIVDGTTSTIALVETSARPFVYRKRVLRSDLSNDQGICWADSEGPFSLDGSTRDGSVEGGGPGVGATFGMNCRNDNEIYSFHPAGANFLFLGGQVSYLNESIDLTVLAALCTRNAGEIPPSDAFQ